MRRRLGRLLHPRPAAPARARLFVKEPCGLCEQALACLRPFQRSGRLTLEVVDIGSDPELLRRYCLTIPVLEVEGGAMLEWPFDDAAVRRALG